jgi:hypothetical protein
LTWAAQHPSFGTLWLGLAGLVAVVPSLRVLLPKGTLAARRGLPVTILTFVAPSWGPWWLAAPVWAVAGAGMGMAIPSISVLTLRYAPPRDRGFASAALQLCDMVFAASTIGVGGVLLTTLASASAPTAAVIPIDLLMAGVALAGAVIFRPGRVAVRR